MEKGTTMSDPNFNAPQGQQPYSAAPQPHPSTSGLAIAGMVLGILSLLTSFIPIINNFAFVLALLALIFGIIGLVGINKGKKTGKGIAIASIVIAVVSIVIVLGTQSLYSAAIDEATSTSTSTTTTESTATDAATNNNTESTNSSDSSVPTEYTSALNRAQTYSDMMHMSYQGIYDQLTSEYGDQFTAEAAQYAVDNVNADWNVNALACAENYQETMSMSPSAIHDQLTSEYGDKFTTEQADYAIANLS